MSAAMCWRWRLPMLLALAAALVWWFWRQAQPQSFPDAPNGQFSCLSYTPDTDGTVGHPELLKARIDRDLTQLSARTHCVRTYSVLNGLDYIAEAARQRQMRVLLGIWISRDGATNDKEIAIAGRLAATHRDVIDAVIVGNEVLLRREQSAEAMRDYLARVKQATQLPVTYADVWDFWLRNPSLADSVDFIAIHILPYWEDFPIGIEHTMEHVQNIYTKMQNAFPGKNIFVGEVGWPSAGRQREAAVPSLMNQARFTREFIEFASQKNIPYNFIEAYDQPWKKGLEGTVGGYWGLYNAEGQPKFALTGPIAQRSNAWLGAQLGLLGMLLSWLLLRAWRQPISGQLIIAACGFSLGALTWLQGEYLLTANRNWKEWLAMSVFTLVAHVCVWLSLLRSIHARQSKLGYGHGIAWLLLLIMLIYVNMGLVFEARYRDFPSVFVLLPILLALHDDIQMTARWQGTYWLASLWLLISGVLIAWLEKLTNHSALLWALLSVLLGLRLMWLALRGRSVYQP